MTRYGRCRLGGSSHWVRVEADHVVLLAEAPWASFPNEPTGLGTAPLPDAWLAPVTPSKILGVAKNYAAHIDELAHLSVNMPETEGPMMFFKPPSALLDPGQAIVLPAESDRVDFEGELAIVIGARCRRVDPARAREVVLGFTALCDVTARDLQKADGQWWRAKGFDTFCPIGPHIVAGLPKEPLTIQTVVNGIVRQQASSELMIHSVEKVIQTISAAMTLEPGDVIALGTPAGVGPLAANDHVKVSVSYPQSAEQIALTPLEVEVRAEAAR